MKEGAKHKRFTFDCRDEVQVVKFCPSELSSWLLAIGTNSRIVVVSCNANKEERCGISDIEFEQIAEYNHGTRVVDICWSPQTNVVTVPRMLRLFSAGADKEVRCLTSDMKQESAIMTVGEHKDYVNAVACSMHESNRNQVASVSDDNTCCVWSLDQPREHLVCFPLTSPGVAVSWHAHDVGKIMVAEKKGVIRFYSVVTERAFMSLDCGQCPLLAAAWSPSNNLRVAALAGTDWFVFDTSRSSYPLENNMAHSDGGRAIDWCQSHDYLLATTGRPGCQLKVFNMRENQIILGHDLKITSGLSWHRQLPIIAVGGDRQVVLWAVDVI